MINTIPASGLNTRELPEDELDTLRAVYKDTTQGSVGDRAAAVVDAIYNRYQQLPSATSLVVALGGSKTPWVNARSAKAQALQTQREQLIKDQAGNAAEDLDSVIEEATTSVKIITDDAVLTAMTSAIERAVNNAFNNGVAAGQERTEALHTERLASVTAQRDSEHDEAVRAAGAEDAVSERLSQLSSEFDRARADTDDATRELNEQIKRLRAERDKARLEAAEARGSLSVWMRTADGGGSGPVKAAL